MCYCTCLVFVGEFQIESTQEWIVLGLCAVLSLMIATMTTGEQAPRMAVFWIFQLWSFVMGMMWIYMLANVIVDILLMY